MLEIWSYMGTKNEADTDLAALLNILLTMKNVFCSPKKKIKRKYIFLRKGGVLSFHILVRQKNKMGLV